MLAGYRLNGQQIKSTVKTASMFAAGQVMALRHLELVLKMRNKATKVLHADA